MKQNTLYDLDAIRASLSEMHAALEAARSTHKLRRQEAEVLTADLYRQAAILKPWDFERLLTKATEAVQAAAAAELRQHTLWTALLRSQNALNP